MPQVYKCKIYFATAIALLVHISGLAGILSPLDNVFIKATPLNLLLMFFLLVFTHHHLNRQFVWFATACFFVGFVAEVVGVNTGILFGTYTYGQVLGPKVLNVPLIIAINWFIVVYTVGVCTAAIENYPVLQKVTKSYPGTWLGVTSIVTGAVVATTFDFIIEPVAIKLAFWQWQGFMVPTYNYWCWFFLSVLLLLLFRRMRISGHNHFAIHLLLIQTFFFLALRLLL